MIIFISFVLGYVISIKNNSQKMYVEQDGKIIRYETMNTKGEKIDVYYVLYPFEFPHINKEEM